MQAVLQTQGSAKPEDGSRPTLLACEIRISVLRGK